MYVFIFYIIPPHRNATGTNAILPDGSCRPTHCTVITMATHDLVTQGSQGISNHGILPSCSGIFWYSHHKGEQLTSLVCPFITSLGGGHVDRLVQETRNSIANALELHLSCANPSMWWFYTQIDNSANHMNHCSYFSSAHNPIHTWFTICTTVPVACLNVLFELHCNILAKYMYQPLQYQHTSNINNRHAGIIHCREILLITNIHRIKLISFHSVSTKQTTCYKAQWKLVMPCMYQTASRGLRY